VEEPVGEGDGVGHVDADGDGVADVVVGDGVADVVGDGLADVELAGGDGLADVVVSDGLGDGVGLELGLGLGLGLPVGVPDDVGEPLGVLDGDLLAVELADADSERPLDVASGVGGLVVRFRVALADVVAFAVGCRVASAAGGPGFTGGSRTPVVGTGAVPNTGIVTPGMPAA
jgi:hypothetical protein